MKRQRVTIGLDEILKTLSPRRRAAIKKRAAQLIAEEVERQRLRKRRKKRGRAG